MARRTILTERQRYALYGLPSEQADLLQHYVLSDQDVVQVNQRRRPENKLGFALQVCALRYPGRLLQPGEEIPTELLSFVGAQIGISADDLLNYGTRKQTRYAHSTSILKLYGFSKFDLTEQIELQEWVQNTAEHAKSNEWLAQAIVNRLRKSKILLPGPSTLERLCATELVSAENRITERITRNLDVQTKRALLDLLEEHVSKTKTRFVWLRQHEVGNNSRVVNDLLDRLELILEINVPQDCFTTVPPHRIARLRRQGERYFADGMRDLPEHRQLAILAVCVHEWRHKISDVLVETHDRIVGKLYKSAERARDAQISDQRVLIQDTIKSFAEVGASLVAAKKAGEPLSPVIDLQGGWKEFSALVDNALAINSKVDADPLDFVITGYARFRRYVPRFLRTLDIQGNEASRPLMTAIDALKSMNVKSSTPSDTHFPITFARPKWRNHLIKNLDRKTWETALLFSLRDSFRSGDLWLKSGRRYGQLSKNLVSIESVRSSNLLAVPFDAQKWFSLKEMQLQTSLALAAKAASKGLLPNSSIKDGKLIVSKLARRSPESTDELILSLYRKLPQIRVTDLLLEVDNDIRFTEAFTDIRTGTPWGSGDIPS